jgi:hypothetical protein
MSENDRSLVAFWAVLVISNLWSVAGYTIIAVAWALVAFLIRAPYWVRMLRGGK